jgi:hypothetical protein
MDEPDAQHRDALARQARVRRIVFGAMFTAAGALLFIHQRTIFDVFGLWPLLLVGLGLVRILGGCCAHCRREGIWLLAIGLWFALNEFTVLRYHDTWPLLLVAIGGLIVWDAVAPRDRCSLCTEGRHAG